MFKSAIQFESYIFQIILAIFSNFGSPLITCFQKQEREICHLSLNIAISADIKGVEDHVNISPAQILY